MLIEGRLTFVKLIIIEGEAEINGSWSNKGRRESVV